MAASSGVSLADKLTNVLMRMEKLEECLFRGVSLGGMQHSLYGGQVVGQALAAAYQTVSPHQHCHSLHAYFIRRGDHKLPVDYLVRNVRDGQTFSTRSVEALQNPQRPIFTMLCSFTAPEPDNVKVNSPIPDVKSPEQCQDVKEFLEHVVKSDSIPEDRRKAAGISLKWLGYFPTELRPLEPEVFYKLKASPEPVVRFWTKLREPSVSELALPMSHSVLSFISDFGILRPAMVTRPDFDAGMITSLDHSVWFHCPMRADDWLLYEAKCNYAGAGRTINRGRIWRQDGALVATVAQEGLVRGKI